jgi:hypothetical protein
MLEDPHLPLVFTRRTAIRLGLTRHAATWRAAHEKWHTLRRGAFCDQAVYEAASAELRHLLVALAAVAAEGRTETVSHLTAALAYGWPGPIDLASEPWFTADPTARTPTRRRSGVIRQVAELPAEHLRQTAEFSMTSPERTVADCLRHFPASISVPLADAALREGVNAAGVLKILAWQAAWPYAGRGRASARLVDGRRESWLESRSAVTFHQLGLQMPDPQVVILDERGHQVARVDYLWTERGVIGEADGWAKYGAPAESEQEADPMRALREEKTREDRLRDLGYEVVRWSTRDVLTPSRLLHDRVRRAFDRADPRRVRGSRRPVEPAAVARRPAPVRLDELRRLAR